MSQNKSIKVELLGIYDSRFLKPFKDELSKRDGTSPIGGAVGRILNVNIFEGRSLP